jgi:predicted nuclease of predicted toxin-antitoxin system
VITKDEDFLHMTVNGPQTPLIWVRLGNCRTPKLLAEFDRLWPRILESLKAGDQVIEIR